MKKELIAITDPKSAVSEMFKTLRTNIQFMNSDKELKTLLVSSTLPGEGKSWTAANLSVSFAQAGKKVLLVDADMRKGRQFNIFGVSPTPGLSNYLSGVVDGDKNEMSFEDFVQETEIENLYIMTAGNVPPNPAELLVSEKMLELNQIVKEKFDITIFDGTPSLLVTDAPILARIVDSTIIVTAHNETKIDNVAKVKKAIENIGGKVAGVVVNKIPLAAAKYENTYYYGQYYGSTTALAVNDNKSRRDRRERKHKHINYMDSQTKHEESNTNYIKEQDTNVEPVIQEKIVTEPEPVISTETVTKPEPFINDDIITPVEPIIQSDYPITENNNQNGDQVSQDNNNDNNHLLEDETQNVINQINQYLNEEKNKLRNGD